MPIDYSNKNSQTHTDGLDKVKTTTRKKKGKKARNTKSKKTEIKRKSKMKPSQPPVVKTPVYSQRENKRKYMIDKIKALA
jgi:hypothetical protein